MNKTLTDNLVEWRKKRNITEPNTKVFVGNCIEELLEIFYLDKNIIKNLKEEILEDYFDLEPLSELNTIDAIQDIQVFAINENELMGYDNDLCNQEVFMHINCRKQDPEQLIEWSEKRPYGKWKKWENQPKDELYEPDYEGCKL